MKKILKEYKYVGLIYIILTLVNVIWIVNSNDATNESKQVKTESNIVYKA